MLHSFPQNAEYTLPYGLPPLVAENPFLTKTPEDSPLPTFDQARSRLPSPVWEGHEDHIRCYWKAWQLAFRNLRKPEPDSGFVSNYIDTAFNDCIFMWDSAFILMFGKYANHIFPFQNTLDNLYSHQHRDGYICREISTYNGMDQFTRFDPSATGPDVLPWCEWEYYLNTGHRERIAQVFPPLMAYHRWLAEHHTWPDGTYFSSGLGCGMDNIPRVQPGYRQRHSHGHMVWVDACMQALFSCDILLKMANLLGRTEFCPELEAERTHLEKVLNQQLWDEKTGFYYDLWKNGQHNGVRHVGAFWALIAGCASSDQARRLAEHLADPHSFCAPAGVPALSMDHPDFCPTGKYWCGGIWPPIHYMILRGLDRYDYPALAHEIANRFLNAVVGVFLETGTLHETYAPEFRDGKPMVGDYAEPDFVGWTGLAPITVLFEYVFGIKPDAHHQKIRWDVRLLERHGIQSYPFGVGGQLQLLCESRQSENQEPQISVTSNIPLELEIIWGDEAHRQSKLLTIPATTNQ